MQPSPLCAFPPYTLSSPHTPAAQLVCFYDKEGQQLQRFDYSRDETEKEFTAAAFNPSGETVIVGSFNRFRTFTLNQVPPPAAAAVASPALPSRRGR